MLKDYADKRDFEVTGEPGPVAATGGSGALTFVIQKHAATNLHYDFRLELDGVLLSWAVPKGPSLDPEEKRLAVHVEDHPLAYGGFEGSIPQGEYGGGEVIIWDRGTYTTPKAPLDRPSQIKELRIQVERGLVEFDLVGEKLRGGWVLIHTRGKQWLLVKRKDEFASDADVLALDHSVVSGRRIGGVPDLEHVVPSRPVVTPPKWEPMLPTESDKPFSKDGWVFELKLDGVRAITEIDGDQIRITTRNGNDVTSRFPVILKQLANLKLKSCVLDGEMVQFNEQGLPNFQLLVQPFQAGRVTTADYCIFDLLCVDGEELVSKPWTERRAALEKLGIKDVNLKVIDAFPRDGELLFQEARKTGFEGIIGKKADSRYRCGKRSPDWVKLKGYLSEEFVIGGFTEGDNARQATFGALLLGRPTEGGLEYMGNVGGGFSDEELTQVRKVLEAIRTKKSPFNGPVEGKKPTWVVPELIVEVKFQNYSNANRVRFPQFLRMRPDASVKFPSSNKAMSGDKKNDEVLEILASLEEKKSEIQIEVQGQKIRFSNLDKEYWPGITKRDLARYYASVSESILRYLKDRPISFVRCPEGVEGERFFQKHLDKGRPEFVEVVSIHSDHNSGARDFLLCNNLPSILWLAQVAVLELNPWNSHISPDVSGDPAKLNFSESKESLEGSYLNLADYLVFDLDPHFGGKATGWRKPEWDRLVEVAFELKRVLETIGLKCFPKSSGKSGLHLYLPTAREYTYDQIRAAATTLAEHAIQSLGPSRANIEWNIKKRPDGVFIDVNQNVRGKTMAAPYSPRASLGAGVSMPLLWDELERVDPTQFTVSTAIDRLREKGDLWAETLNLSQHLFS